MNNKMFLNSKEFTKEEHDALVKYVYDVVGSGIQVRKELPCSLPEYIYQEAFMEVLESKGLHAIKEFKHHPIFRGKEMNSFVRMDFVIPQPEGNIIVEAKSIEKLTSKERAQLFGYMVATGFPYGILINFATYPHPQIERYYFDQNDMTLSAF